MKNLKNAKVPSLITQPLVENAIKHGISKRPEGGTVSITAKEAYTNSKKYLELKLVNDIGKNGKDKHGIGYGIGTVNVKDRLKTALWK